MFRRRQTLLAIALAAFTTTGIATAARRRQPRADERLQLQCIVVERLEHEQHDRR